MGQAASCFKGQASELVADSTPVKPVVVSQGPVHPGPDSKQASSTATVLVAANQQDQQGQQQSQASSGSSNHAAEPVADEKAQGTAAAAAADDAGLDPSLACCLGAARLPGGPHDVSLSGPPLPGCEAERLEESHLGEMLDFAPKDELQNILSLVCNMFSVKNALVSLFFDRRIYIIDGTGAFTEGDFPWRYSMCGWTMASERHCVMIVNDVKQDARFCNSPVAEQFGVRFYVGSPLVSSSGHRLGTLCFADSKPRVFDAHSLKLLNNFSELVTRALERDIVLAHHQQVRKPGEALKELETKHKYRMLLRSIDCVSSAVLLVDTGAPGWVVRYANAGWQGLVQHRLQTQATQDWVNNTAASSADLSSGRLPTIHADAPTAAADDSAAAGIAISSSSGGLGGASSVNARDLSGNAIVGYLLWPIVEQQLDKEPDGGSSIKQQLQLLLRARQPFTLHVLELPGLCSGDVTASLVFRCAGESDIEGAVSICVPAWVPQPGNVPAAAAALQATAADKAAPSTTCPSWQTLYFVTVLLESTQRREGRLVPGLAASTCGSFSVSQGRRVGRSSMSNSSVSSISLSVPAAGNNSGTRCIQEESDLLVMSSLNTSAFSAIAEGSASSNVQQDLSGVLPSISGSQASSLVGSCQASITSSSAASAARAVCRRIDGLQLGGLIASGSYGRVYRGDYFGSTVAVKVLESDSVLRREALSGLCLEALLGEKFKHPNIINTLAWAVVTGKSKLSVGKRLWGETLDAGKPSIAENKAAVSAAQRGGTAAPTAQPPAPARRVSSDTRSARDSMDASASVSQQLPCLEEEEEGVSTSNNSSSSSLMSGETWLVLEYCNKGCLQDAVDRGWLRDGPGGAVSLVKVIVTAAEIAAGMFTLHSANVVHGDLSPFNVLLSGTDPAAAEAGRGFAAKISDFGLSRPLGQQSKMLTKTYGTITHMSPELLEHGLSSKAVDVYSFGVLLWQMLASSRAWVGLSHQAVVHTVCVKKAQLQFPADAPEALVELGQACMSYSPGDRPTFQDILDVLLPLREFVSQNMGAG